MTSEVTSPRNITISVLGNEVCDDLRTLGLFRTAIDVYRTALCLALARKLPVDESVKFAVNKWDTAAVFRDPDSNLEALLMLHGYGKDEVVTKGKYLAEAGLKFLNDKRLANVDLLSVILDQ